MYRSGSMSTIFVSLVASTTGFNLQSILRYPIFRGFQSTVKLLTFTTKCSVNISSYPTSTS